MYVKEDISSVPHFDTRCCNEMNSISITEDDLLHKLSHLNTSKAMGPDKIHAWVLKEGHFGLCKPLSMLYILTLECGNSPQTGNKHFYTDIQKGVSV